MIYRNNIPLFGGLFAALLSSACCIFPLLFLLIGISGSWISNLTALEPYKPLFIGGSLLLLSIAYWQLFLKKQACEAGKICAIPKNQKRYKTIFWLSCSIVLISSSIDYWSPLFY